MDQTGQTLTTLYVEDWAEWMLYLLERLEGEADEERYVQFLETLQLAITTRLEEGIW